MLVALAVVAISLAAIGSLIAVTTRGARAVGLHLTLVETARAIITGLPDRNQLVPGNFSGETAGHRWRVDVMPFIRGFRRPASSRRTGCRRPWWCGCSRPPARSCKSTPFGCGGGRPNERRARAIAGFTLVEALLATALMGAILAAIATVTAQWLPNWNRGFARVQGTETLAVGLERIVADLAAAEFVTAGAGIRQPVFDGTELSVTFLRSAIGPNTRPGLELVRIGETGGDKGLMTVRTRARFCPDGPDGAEVQAAPSNPVVLVRAPYRVTFSYAGPDRVWRPVWRSAGMSCRRAIRVQLRDAATDRTLSVSTATPVHANMPADCVLAEVIARLPEPPRHARTDGRVRADASAPASISCAYDPAATASSWWRCCGSWPRSPRWRRSSRCMSSTRRPRSRCMTSGFRPKG